METVSENKRGRKSAYATHTKDGDKFKDVVRSMYPELESDRAITNELYVVEGLQIAEQICNVKAVFYTTKGKCKGKCVLEQIGRMHLQNNYDIESCKTALSVALEAKKGGATVRQIEKF